MWKLRGRDSGPTLQGSAQVTQRPQCDREHGRHRKKPECPGTVGMRCMTREGLGGPVSADLALWLGFRRQAGLGSGGRLRKAISRDCLWGWEGVT